MAPRVCVFGGDGAAPEAVEPTVRLLERIDVDIEITSPSVEQHETALAAGTLPPELRKAIDTAEAVLFGATDGGHAGVFQYLRHEYGGGLPANVRPVQYLDGATSPLSDPGGIDYTIVRENIEGAYFRAEGELETLADSELDLTGATLDVDGLGPGGYGLRVMSERNARWLSEFACELAAERSADPLVTCGTKSNVLPETDGLLESAVEEAADRYDVSYEHLHADDLGQRLVRDPHRFDVIVTPNIVGDVLSEVAAGTVGGIGLAPSGCYGAETAYFEPVHGTAPDIAGEEVINPTGTVLSAVLLLRYVGQEAAATRLKQAVESVYADGAPLTPDQGGTASTGRMVDAIERRF